MRNHDPHRSGAAALCRVALLPVAAVLLLGAGCWSGSDDDGDSAPILSAANDCWKSRNCAYCHDVPVEGHTETEPDRCARCHGGNGALDPNHPDSNKYHQMSEDCVSCHVANHTFDQSSQCARCHFAAEGVDPG